jgi:hypothetical protein
MIKVKIERTLSVYPQEGLGGFPFIEYAALKKPLNGTAVMSFGCNVMINGWIWGRKPSKKTISEQVPYKVVLALGTTGMN